MSTLDKVGRLEDVVAQRERWRAEGKTVALANGIFDLLHVGHVRYLQGAKALADQGAELAFSYQGEAFGKRVEPLEPGVERKQVHRCQGHASLCVGGRP